MTTSIGTVHNTHTWARPASDYTITIPDGHLQYARGDQTIGQTFRSMHDLARITSLATGKTDPTSTDVHTHLQANPDAIQLIESGPRDTPTYRQRRRILAATTQQLDTPEQATGQLAAALADTRHAPDHVASRYTPLAGTHTWHLGNPHTTGYGASIWAALQATQTLHDTYTVWDCRLGIGIRADDLAIPFTAPATPEGHPITHQETSLLAARGLWQIDTSHYTPDQWAKHNKVPAASATAWILQEATAHNGHRTPGIDMITAVTIGNGMLCEPGVLPALAGLYLETHLGWRP